MKFIAFVLILTGCSSVQHFNFAKADYTITETFRKCEGQKCVAVTETR